MPSVPRVAAEMRGSLCCRTKRAIRPPSGRRASALGGYIGGLSAPPPRRDRNNTPVQGLTADRADRAPTAPMNHGPNDFSDLEATGPDRALPCRLEKQPGFGAHEALPPAAGLPVLLDANFAAFEQHLHGTLKIALAIAPPLWPEQEKPGRVIAGVA